MRKELQELEQRIMSYVARHPAVANGVGYHTAPVRSVTWHDEQMVPKLLRAFSPAVLAREIERRLGGEIKLAKTEPRRGEGIEADNRFASWFIDKLFELVDDNSVPATTRVGVLERIRELTGHCAAALHKPLRDELAKDDETEEDSGLSPFEAYQRKKAAGIA